MRIIAGLEDDGWHRLEESGAYEWWYFDAVSDDQALAIVTIWFVGMPFSPEYLSAHERALGPNALDYVSLFVGLYWRGTPVAYALNMYDRSAFEASERAPELRIGPNALAFDERRFRLALDLPVLVDNPAMLKRGRLTGSLTFEPRYLLSSRDVAGEAPADHVWNPVAPDCRVRGAMDVTDDKGTIWEGGVSGRGYHDHNYGRRPLTEGIRRWHWGRAHAGDATLLYYHTEMEGGGAESYFAIHRAAGDELAPAATFEADRWTWRPLCPRHPRRVRVGADGADGLGLVGRVRDVVDWGPFYMRFLTEFSVTDAGVETARALGVSEYFDPVGLRRRIYRPLVRTRIRRVVV